MKQKLLWVFSFFLFFTGHVWAQNKLVKGTVTDSATNTPVIGASVTVSNTTIGTTTNNEGQFSINIPAGTKTLKIFALSYKVQMIDVGANATLGISLAPETKGLEEVVVIGYGKQKKKDLTGAIATIGSEEIAGRQTVQVSEALQGTIPGVSVTRSSAAPGAGSSVLVRGITTLNTNSPLVVVDGVPVSSMDNVNPNDIETLSVLKDASAASIYGSRGAAGVILITTKRASAGQANLEYNYEFGLQKPTALPEYANSPDYMRYFNEQAVNDGATTGPYPQDFITHFADSAARYPDRFPFTNTNWQDLIMTNKFAPRQQHDLVFTLGTKTVKTKASVGYSKVGAFYDHYDYERFLIRVNNDLQINNKLSGTIDIALKRTNNNAPQNYQFGTSPIYEARLMPSIYDAFYSNGQYAIAKDGRNPIAQLNEGGFNNSRLNQLQGRMSLIYKPVKDLSLTALISPTFDLDKSKTFAKKITFTNPDGSASSATNQPRTNLSESRTENYQVTGQFLADYNKSIAQKHNIGALVGFEGIYNSNESLTASRSGFVLTDFPYLNAGSQEFRDNSGSAFETALRSFFGRVTYDFDSKYYLQANLRYDQSSRFASQYRDAIFPSFSAGWSVTEEKFMKNISWLSFLKLRGSWGEVGNERIGNYPYQSTISFSNALFYQNGVVVPINGGGQVTYAVNNISWETTQSADVGIDAAFLNNRLNVTADYYKKRTSDILLPLDIPLFLGFEKPSQNAGTLDVKGWELGINWKDKLGKLNYSVGLNISDAKSKIIDMKGTQFLGDQATFVGSEFNEWFGYRSAGIYQTQADAATSPRLNTNVTAGDIRYQDMNGDGKITPDDKVLLGGSLPRYQYGGNLRLDYQGFDFGLVFQGVGKRISRMNNDVVQPFLEAFGNFPQLLAGNYWSPNNTPEQNLSAQYPRLSRTGTANNYALSNFWLINGAYFRLKNITLGYTLRKDFLKKIGVDYFRFYLSGNDLATISNFPKFSDPESGNAAYPIVSTFLGGVSVQF